MKTRERKPLPEAPCRARRKECVPNQSQTLSPRLARTSQTQAGRGATTESPLLPCNERTLNSHYHYKALRVESSHHRKRRNMVG